MRINQERIVNEFMELVQINSFAGQERQIADALTKKLKKLGCQVTEDNAGATINGNAGNLIAKLPGDPNKETVMFCAHMDRVAPGNNIKPQITDGVITSDGTTILAADDVAGIVAVLEAIRTAQEQNIDHGNIEIVFTIAEEGGLNGAKALDTSVLEAKMAYFLDSGGPIGTIVNQAPSQKGIDFTFYGIAAHAGVAPEKGVNAIKIAAEAIANMDFGRIDKETTANIGVIKGGVATNIVTDHVAVGGEVRSLAPDKLQKQTDHMINTAKQAAQKHGMKLDIAIQDSYPSFSIPPTALVIELAVKAAKAIGVKPIIESTGGGSDANIINGHGLPSVILGMNYFDVHTTSERIAIDDLCAGAEYVLAIMELA